jgi:hypothetical protein
MPDTVRFWLHAEGAAALLAGALLYRSLGLGAWLPSTPLEIGGAILMAHVGIDRLAGYGLKHSTGFKDTHLQRA